MTDQPTPRAPEPGRWRKKPVVIEARQWDGTASGATPLIDWMLAADTTARYHEPEEVHVDRRREYLPPKIAIDTLEGVITASPGDWIIRGVQGEFYPCKPDIFEATYESADAAPEPTAPDDAADRCPMCGHGFHHDTDCGEVVGYDHLNGYHECGCPGETASDDLPEQIAEALAGLEWPDGEPMRMAREHRLILAAAVMNVLRRNGMVPR